MPALHSYTVTESRTVMVTASDSVAAITVAQKAFTEGQDGHRLKDRKDLDVRHGNTIGRIMQTELSAKQTS